MFPLLTLPLSFRRVLWLPLRFQLDLNQTPIGFQTATEQTFLDKTVNCPCTTASFTVPPEPLGFVVLWQLIPEVSAFYDVSVRRLTGLPPASYAFGRLRQQTFPREFAPAFG